MNQEEREDSRFARETKRRQTGERAPDDGVGRRCLARRAREERGNNSIEPRRSSWMRAQRSVTALVSEARRRLRLRKIRKIGDATSGGVEVVVSGATRACHGKTQMSSSGKSDSANIIRVLAFEDGYDIKSILSCGLGETYERIQLEQEWTSEDFLEKIERFKPDVLLLDFYMPPHTGLVVLKKLNEAVQEGRIERPKFVLGMSSEALCNNQLTSEGADAAFEKWKIGSWEGWRT